MSFKDKNIKWNLIITQFLVEIIKLECLEMNDQKSMSYLSIKPVKDPYFIVKLYYSSNVVVNYMLLLRFYYCFVVTPINLTNILSVWL